MSLVGSLTFGRIAGGQVRRWCWAAVFLVGLALTANQVEKVVLDYVNYPTNTKVPTYYEY